MSLINDALKQADRRKQTRPVSETHAAANLQPVNHPQNSPLLLTVTAALVVVFGASGIFFIARALSAKETVQAREYAPAVAQEMSPQPAQAPGAELTAETVMEIQAPVAETVTAEAAAPPVVVPEPQVWYDTLRLEGIMYHPKQPSVLVNGKSVFIGERVNGITLVDVEMDNATFEFDGQRKTFLIR